MWKVRKADTGKVYAAEDLRSLQTWCRDGRVLEDDFVRSDEDVDWQLASRVFDLAAHFRRPGGAVATAGAAAGAAVQGGGRGRASQRNVSARAAASEDVDPDLTSMMDMAFILVILLMVISTPAFQNSLPVNLPGSEGSGKIESRDLTVAVTKDGEIRIAGETESVALEGLAKALTDRLGDRIQTEFQAGQTKLVLSADEELKHGMVIAVYDQIAKAGITNISVSTKPKESR